ncbi:MAG: ATP-binding cassette domain-containing protein, partial [Proteobacteria bacterium]
MQNLLVPSRSRNSKRSSKKSCRAKSKFRIFTNKVRSKNMAVSPVIRFTKVAKHFGDCVSCRELNFEVAGGSIHAIVGENGAGKSTAMKMLFGLYKLTSGLIELNNQTINFDSPIDATAAGIGMVHQHFMLAPSLSALDNVLLFQKGIKGFQRLQRADNQKRLQTLAQKFGFQIDWNKAVADLSVGTQQRIEILKILAQGARVLILDEPTAVLTPQETSELFANLRMLRAEGCTILLVTHKLKEVLAIADAVTVLRAGVSIATKPIAATSAQDIAELMVGRKVIDWSTQHREQMADPKILLETKSLSCAPQFGSLHDVAIKVHTGEIVGIAGVEGNGQDQLIQALLD